MTGCEVKMNDGCYAHYDSNLSGKTDEARTVFVAILECSSETCLNRCPERVYLGYVGSSAMRMSIMCHSPRHFDSNIPEQQFTHIPLYLTPLAESTHAQNI